MERNLFAALHPNKRTFKIHFSASSLNSPPHSLPVSPDSSPRDSYHGYQACDAAHERDMLESSLRNCNKGKREKIAAKGLTDAKPVSSLALIVMASCTADHTELIAPRLAR